VNAVTVAVIGGGPAGSLTAYLLARAGIDVGVFERSRTGAPDRGEVLAAEGRSVLARVGLWDRRPAAVLAPCNSIRVAWRSGPTAERLGITSPYGCAWHVNRPAFDRWLYEEALCAGARGARPTSVREVRRTGAGWELAVDGPSVARWVDARVVVHAGGRCSMRADWFGAMPRRYDALCAVIGRYSPGSEGTTGLAVEATPDGWWYSTARSGSDVVATLVTDPDLLAVGGRGEAAMRIALERAPLTRARVRSVAAATFTVSACSTIMELAAGEGWLAVGDAAIARDPLSGEGVVSAMRSAVVAANAIEDHVRGDFAAIGAYAAQMRTSARDYLAARREIYAGQTRWPDRPFWQRRAAFADRSHAA
jgi:flavin-dependent dehydrogenase